MNKQIMLSGKYNEIRIIISFWKCKMS